jgi:probable F420-dependent oxidoreductase
MKFGLFDMGAGPCLDPQVLLAVAKHAEDAGLESLWCGEHIVLPDPRVPPSPMEPTDPILDLVIALTFAAAVTHTIRLGTGVVILPQRNPLVLAKELASLDVLSGGRLIFGVGVGYLEPEFRAVGVPLRDHGPRSDDYLAAMRAIWSQPRPSHTGRFTSFNGVNAYPRPVQQPTPELVVGGHTMPAYRRSVEQASGWYGFGLDHAATAESLRGLREAAERYPRPAELPALEISITPPYEVDALDPTVLARYAELGVHRLILRAPRGADASALHAHVDRIGRVTATA